MEKKVILITACILISIMSFLGFRIYKTIQQKKMTEKSTEKLPAFSFTAIDNKTFSNVDLPNANSKIIFNFFSPNCEHCQYMATQYFKNREQIKDATIIMVSIADSNSVTKFNKDYQLSTLPNLISLRDTKFQFYKIFGTATVPSFFIYEHQKLIKKIIGETKIENLINPVKE